MRNEKVIETIKIEDNYFVLKKRLNLLIKNNDLIIVERGKDNLIWEGNKNKKFNFYISILGKEKNILDFFEEIKNEKQIGIQNHNFALKEEGGYLQLFMELEIIVNSQEIDIEKYNKLQRNFFKKTFERNKNNMRGY
ncbi:hypothetical protein [Cetobacterium sp. SF1]|uniref:hypothetical protein n=1 Tax=Cetobacterium sp. SF1 TaxID=3417654 RepID=UPI003CF1BE69